MFRISRFFKRVSVCVACVSVLAVSPVLAGDADPYWEGRKWEAWTEIGGYAANRSYARRGELALWAPFMQDRNSLFFVDLRGKLFAEDQEEGNAAVGYRFMRHDGWNPGIWIGLDRRNTESGTNFDQAAFGAELLSEDWDFRVNGYVPLNDRELVSTTDGVPVVEVTGSQIFLVSGSDIYDYEIAMWGADAEIGWRVPLERFGHDPTRGLNLNDGGDALSGRHHELRLYAGGFYFDHKDFDGEVAGPRARAEWRIGNIFEDWDGSRLTFEAAWQHDDVRDHQIEGGVRLRIPLGSGGDSGLSRNPLNAQERRMTEGLKRDTDIVSQSQTVVADGGGAPELVEDAETGVDFDTVVTVANGASLQNGITTAGVNALVIALGGETNFDAISMHGDQTLLGGGGTIQVRGRNSGTVAAYTAPGTRPTISALDDNAVNMVNNSHLAGVDTQDGLAGILVSGHDLRAVITDVTTQGTSRGLFIANSGGHVTVRRAHLEGSGVGIRVDASDGATLEIFDSTLTGGTNALEIDSGINLTLANTRFEGEPLRLVVFETGSSTVAAGSTGNVKATGSDARECAYESGAFTGTLGFNTGGFPFDKCTQLH